MFRHATRTCIAASATLALLVAGCAIDAPSPEEAAASFRQSRHYDSLEIVAKSLSPGTSSAEVERLLGEPDYCPTSGLCYYSSSRMAPGKKGGADTNLGLVVDYRDGGGVTKALQKYWLGPIGE